MLTPTALGGSAPTGRRAGKLSSRAEATLPIATKLRRSTNGRRTVAPVRAMAFSDPMPEARIKVIGCGGGGGNAVNRMINSGLQVASSPRVPTPPDTQYTRKHPTPRGLIIRICSSFVINNLYHYAHVFLAPPNDLALETPFSFSSLLSRTLTRFLSSTYATHARQHTVLFLS